MAQSPENEPNLSPAMAIAGGIYPKARILPDFSPPLIAMVAVLGTALLIVLYSRLLSHLLRRMYKKWRRNRRHRTPVLSVTNSDAGSIPPLGFDDYYFSLSPYYGLDESAIKALPLSVYLKGKGKHRDCAVCLREFEDDDWLRTLPACTHAFHADCIDAWLRSHATCPLCRTAASRRSTQSPLPSPSPFVPMRAARIRPSFDDIILGPPPPLPPDAALLKRSYSLGFERGERVALEATSPWRYWGLWSKRWASPFGSSSSVRVFSFRSQNRGLGLRSPFVVRRRGFFLPLSSERRRTRWVASPGRAWGMSSSRTRCGDPEALLSPDRLSRRQ